MNAFDQLHREAGLQIAGIYAGGKFHIEPAWRSKAAVYVWSVPEDTGFRPVRVGKACGRDGLGGRHALHNRWLAGLFKPHDAREQVIAKLTRERLGSEAALFARSVADDLEGKRVERELVRRWAPLLDLDLTIPGSWAKRRMRELPGGYPPLARRWTDIGKRGGTCFGA